jgi:hypothetical protein
LEGHLLERGRFQKAPDRVVGSKVDHFSAPSRRRSRAGRCGRARSGNPADG